MKTSFAVACARCFGSDVPFLSKVADELRSEGPSPIETKECSSKCLKSLRISNTCGWEGVATDTSRVGDRKYLSALESMP